MLTIKTFTRFGRPFLNVHFQPGSQWKWFFGTSWTPPILEISWHHTSCVTSCDHDQHLIWKCIHWQKDHFCIKSYHVTSVVNNVINPLISNTSGLHDMSSWNSQSNFEEKIWLLPWQEILMFTSIETRTKLCPDIMLWFYMYFSLFIFGHVLFV